MSQNIVPQSLPQVATPNFKERIEILSGNVLGGNKSVASIALLASLVAAVIVVGLWTSAQNYVPLYGNQEHYDKAQIVEVLENEEFEFKIDSDSGNILVPQNKLADARITLSARGIKAAMPEGLSTIQDKVSMATSQFMETKQYHHALEGELAHTIITMDGVRNARVHLALPKRQLFVGRSEEKKAASVMVDLAPGYQLQNEQVESIVSLVAGSVPGLEPKNISVVDQRGQLLSGHLYDESPIGKQSNKKLAFKESLENNITQRASAMLLPILGDGNFRIQVSSDVDFNVVEETKEEIDPEAIVASERTKSDNTLDQIALGIPGTLANTPPVGGNETEGDDDNQRTTERTESSREFEHGRVVKHTKYEVGRLTSMSVSVLLNDTVAPNKLWEDTQLEQIGNMVKAATGFQSARGDQFNISSFPFTEIESINNPMQEVPWWQLPIIHDYARYLIGLLISILILIFGVRPLVKNLVSNDRGAGNTNRKDKMSGDNDDLSTSSTPSSSELNDTSSDSVSVVSPADDEADGYSTSTSASDSEERSGIHMMLPDVGSAFDEQIKHMRLLAAKEPERVSAVIKHWVDRGVNVERAGNE
ncbi:flagellar basal-body MS-ring/collar protein FliF [Alteromonas sp. S015]|uniref:flagellar basal-body MS-ring/collar protein FliF n=1 Tax=Alteromonas sp. S015 TaxID=3117401 RepID=UPI002FE41799